MRSPLRRTWNVLAVFVVATWLFPVYWVVMTSLKADRDINTATPKFVFDPTVNNYQEIFDRFQFGKVLINSFVIVSAATAITITLALLAAYSLARMRLRGANALALVILSFRFMPGVVVVLPYYLTFSELRLTDSYTGMVLVYVAFGLPFAVWLLRGFLLDLPQDIDEAARLDGLGRLAILRRIVLPLAAPGVAVTAIFTFVFNWNEYLFALILTDARALTVPVQISKMIDAYSVLWGDLSAAVVLQLIPMVIVVFLLQRHIVRGLALGAVK